MTFRTTWNGYFTDKAKEGMSTASSNFELEPARVLFVAKDSRTSPCFLASKVIASARELSRRVTTEETKHKQPVSIHKRVDPKQ